MTSIAERLAQFVSEAEPPNDVLTTARFCLFDWASCAIAGANEPVAQSVRRMINSEAGAPLSSVIGQDLRVPPRAAALANGTISHALDYDDTHFAHIGHPSVAVIPAALACGEARKASADDVSHAIALGAEASIAIGLWLGRRHYQAGFHQTATAGAFGAAVAAARIASLSDTQFIHALNLLATRVSGLKVQFGSMGKPLNAGIAASNGVEAVLLAEAGMIAPTDAISGQFGFGALHDGEGNVTPLSELRTMWHLPEISFKMHACCHGLHAMIEALLKLDLRTPPDRIQVQTHPRWRTVCDIADPVSALETKFSFRHVAAMVVRGQDTAGLSTFSDASALDSELASIRQRVEVVTNPDLAETAAIVHADAQGAAQTASADIAEAHPADYIAQRLKAKSGALLGNERTAALWATVQDGDLEALGAILRSPAALPEG